MVRALDVANLFLHWANTAGDLISNLKMQKLLYYAQAWHLVNFRQRLFSDPIEAWDLGPVIRSVYSKYRKHGYGPISYKGTCHEEDVFSSGQIEFLKEF